MTDHTHEPCTNASQDGASQGTSPAKRPYRSPALAPIGSVRDMTLKTGSTPDNIFPGQSKPAGNPL